MNVSTTNMQQMRRGALYVVATPIGHLGDITLRALETLRQVDLVVAEDTRHSRRLLAHHEIKAPLLSLHAHNERARTAQCLERLVAGMHIALISDAGTPLISDPGADLVRAAREAGIKVMPVPGVCAAIAAISASGLPADRFVFEGFLPAKVGARRKRLAALRGERRTVILYEAPHRIVGLLGAVQETIGEARRVVVARELTKVFETFYDAPVGQVLARLRADPVQRRGEFVVLIAGDPEPADEASHAESGRVLRVLLEALPKAQAIALTAKLMGGGKNKLYKATLSR